MMSFEGRSGGAHNLQNTVNCILQICVSSSILMVMRKVQYQ